MKKLLLGILCFSAFAVHAQDAEVSSSTELTNAFPENPWTKTLGQTDDAYYLLRKFGPISNETQLLEKYDTKMNLVYAENIESGSGVQGDAMYHRLTEFCNGEVLVFLEGWNKAKGENSFHVASVNGDDGSVGEPVLLETEPAQKLLKSAKYSVSFSPDGSKLLVLTQKPFTKGSKEDIRLQVFATSDFSSVWKQDITLNNESKKNPRNSIAVNNDGVAYLLSDFKISMKEHSFKLITAGDGFDNSEDLNLTSYQPTHHQMVIGDNGDLMISAMLTEGIPTSTIWHALWYLKANPQGEIVSNRIEPLGADVLRNEMSEAKAAKPDSKFDNYILKDVLLKSDGGLLMITEKVSTTKAAIGTATPPVYNYTVVHGALLVFSFDADGKWLWSNYYGKGQTTVTRDPDAHLNSFAYNLVNDDLYIVWNFMDYTAWSLTIQYRWWRDNNGDKINIDNLFGKEAVHPTMLMVIKSDGTLGYQERTFNCLPLTDIQKPNAFPMAIDANMFFPIEGGIVVMSRMTGFGKRYKFNTIKF